MRRRAEGVYLASNGNHWQAVWWDANGRRVRKSLGPKSRITRTAARTLCARIAAGHAINPSTKTPCDPGTLGQWKARYLALRTDLAPGTKTCFEDTLGRLSTYFGDARKLDSISRADAEDFRAWASGIKGRNGTLSPQTVARYIRDCRVIFGWAHRQDLIPINPFDRVSAAAPPVSKTWAFVTRQQLETILDKCPSSAWRNLFALCRLAGLRVGEAERLTWADVDWTARTLTVQAQREDTKHRRRVVPIEPRLYEVLRESFESATPKIARVCDLPDQNRHRDALVIIKHAGLRAYAKPFHTLRKNLESEWLAQHPLLAVCEWLGHSPEVASKHYHRPTDEVVARVTATILPQST